MRPSKLFALATAALVVGMTVASSSAAQTPAPPFVDAMFPVMGHGLLNIPPERTVGILMPDSTRVLFQNTDSGLVVWANGIRVRTITYFVTRLPSPFAPAMLKIDGLEVIFAARHEGAILVGVVYGPLFPERAAHDSLTAHERMSNG